MSAEEKEAESENENDDDDEGERIKRIVDAGDLEQLAEIVLNGEGGSLVGLKSQEPEIQAFLNNVPSYMEKIHRVHDAARDGGLLALQQALDRRKFAIAKNDISPNGSTPLHVAVLFGHTDIVRYLASRFPETMTITDNDGRTALHYAATIKDNGHFYNMLLQLGANPKVLDKLGHSAEFYLDKDKAKNILNYTELLNIFGAEELENQLLNDQGQAQPVSFQANPIFKTEQGKYLANSLADPLIKALTEIANKRPKDPVAYLTNYLQHFMGDRKPMTEVQVHSGSSKASTSSTSTLALAKSNASSNPRLASTRNGPGPTNADLIELDSRSLAEEEDAEGALAVQHMEERDEHGQSMLHFACARSHRRGALYTLIEESGIDITYRDELYRTARDVSLQANQPNNAAEIDRYVLAQAVIGNVEPFEQLALQGYDHILDIEDENGQSIIDVVQSRQHEALGEFLTNLRALEETREELHQMIRENNMERVMELTDVANAKWLVKTKNYYGRTALHIAVLKESEEVVQRLVKICPEALKIPDNLDRTVLHYAMGTNALETVSRILIQNGAKRTAKDLKGRQPSYYFINKADILRLQEEEEESR
ncbi:serine/threonine-protein phosphatase 6 regulatory ankyrin repeat subunit A isoform X5 [Drosophila suzukii]|uniref:Serine/threonine-protein phosphatase 6 regulatory ankyrin repeat subunit A isoform X5 n=1 Tax=Drosophila suzukii TaxID=28584 RepID=A0AB40DA86_DROSZ